ncbi:MAG: mannonate dehydratase, partial [Bryobacteraceae bacterium]|nr:mannonate dehydratase [Bryobacteraceae bacterium]
MISLSRRLILSLPAALLPAAETWEPRVAENIGELSGSTLGWLAQLGHQWVVLQGTDKVDRDGKGYWSLADIEAVQARCREFGLRLHSLMIPIGWLKPAMLALPGREGAIEAITRSIEAAGKAGVAVLEWRWSPDFVWGAEAGYFDEPARGGAIYKAFDYHRVKDAPPYAELGAITREQLWERMRYFLERVLPAAERAGVRLSMHPKDPPVPVLRGIERMVTNTAEIERFVDAFQTPAHGFTFCQGTVTEMGVDVVDAIWRIGRRGRIHHVHFRNVQGRVPRYTETFIDDGQVDMLAAMRAYREVGYKGSLVSDHTPSIPGDLPGGRIGRSFSQGYIRGLVQAANAPKGRPGVKLKLALGIGDLSGRT